MLVEAVLFLVLVFLLWQTFRKPPRLPPGPWGLPLLGYIPLFSSKSIEEHVMDLNKKHGDIFLWRMGTQVMVFLHDYRLVKEACTRPEFMDRPDWEIFKFFEDPAVGIAGSNGAQWHNNRRFTLRQLRDLGMGKSKLVATIHDQVVQLRDAIAKQGGRPGPIPHELSLGLVNVIWHMTADRQFSMSDLRVKRFIDMLTELLVSSIRFSYKDFLPWLQYLMPPFIFRYLIKYNTMINIKKDFFKYFYEEIDQHRATLDPANPRDVIDAYLLEEEARKNDPENTFCDRDLAFLIFDLFFAATETTATTFHWLCCYLANYTKVQTKMQAEIDATLPKGTLATLAEKSKMPYTEAVINEVMRCASVANFSLQRKATTDTELGGYVIPKGTILNSSVFAIHVDDQYWKRPDEFLPERWLDEEGKFSLKKEGYLPFSVGKRVCPGEGLARMQLFILMTTIFQSFTVAAPRGKTVDLNTLLGGLIVRKPAYNEFAFIPRE